MEPRKPKQSPGDPNGAHRAKSNDLAMLCYVQASEKLECDFFAIRLSFIDFLSKWASWAPFGPPALHLGLLGSTWASWAPA